jgi:amino acid permease
MKAISWVRTIPLRVQLAFIGCGYVAVLAYAVMAKYMRHLAELKDPVGASGGMWAFGDELLAWSIFFCFMVPTFFLVLLLRQHEHSSGVYSRVLFWISLTAPLCLGISMIGQAAHHQDLVDPLLWRTWRGPFALMLIAMSRVFARFDAAKRILTRALLIEGGTLAICVALLIFAR